MNLSKKFTVVQKGDNPALGNFVHYYLHTNHIASSKVCSGLKVSKQTFNRYLKQNSFQFTILWRMSQIVNYNFLMDLGEWLNIPYETKAEKVLKSELEQKNALLEKKQLEINLLKEMFSINKIKEYK